MKVRANNQIELSYANALALVQEYERRVAQGTRGWAEVYKQVDGDIVSVSIVADDEHYTEHELAQRRSPYLPPEAWAGV